jgi:LPS export ABC transporter protein LptC
MKNRIVQVFLSVALLALVVQIVLIAPRQIRDSESRAALMPTPEFDRTQGPAGNPNGVDQSMGAMHMIETQEGRKEWELWSDKAISLKAQDILELESVKAIFFSDNGVEFTVTGEKGTVQTKTKNLSVEGNVITRTSNGYTFKTHSVDYESKFRQLKTVDHVEMFGPKDSQGNSLHLTGIGMDASLIRSTMEVQNDVKGEMTLEDGRIAYIKSHRSLFTAKDKTAKFYDDVVLDLDSMRITGPVANFAYDPKADQVRSVVVEGGARVSDIDKWATAQNVSVDFESNKFVFRGSPRVVQNNDELIGDEIIFLNGGKQVQVERARAKVDEKRLEKKN